MNYNGNHADFSWASERCSQASKNVIHIFSWASIFFNIFQLLLCKL